MITRYIRVVLVYLRKITFMDRSIDLSSVVRSISIGRRTGVDLRIRVEFPSRSRLIPDLPAREIPAVPDLMPRRVVRFALPEVVWRDPDAVVRSDLVQT